MLRSAARFWRQTPQLYKRQAFTRDFTIAIDGPAASGKSSTARAVAQELGFGYIDSGSIYRCATLLALRNNIASDIDKHWPELIDLIGKTGVEIKIQPNSNRSLSVVAAKTGRLVVPSVQILLDGEDVSNDIRTPEVNRLVAKVASDGGVRSAVLNIQRSLAANADTKATETQGNGKDPHVIPGGVVMDGRDVGTTVFPNAELKIYLDASAMARAIRRWDEMNSQLKNKQTEEAARKQENKADTSVPVEYPSVEDIARELEQRDYADINRQHSPLRIAPDAVVIDNTNLTFEQQVYSITDLARERMGLQRKYDDI
ncbi:hypothetical protein IWW36_005006 [Coemansia brasiliensis]|uniref:(d)CMP kinase n=1 Tax=Coemansia brasiliensis TaxID=2650707 RepID=A0A9W8I785_9FUNG|nr:hypothetical protein IWW36_005006 [Coemansia brasiliensis]